MKYIVNFSGGITSWAAAKMIIERYGTEEVTLLFADTLIEDSDLYRFLGDAVANLGARFVRIAEGRDPWQVFFDTRFLGNSRVDPCSRVLKRNLLDTWRREAFTNEPVTRVVGITWDEEHRLGPIRARLAPDTVLAPLCEPPYLSKSDAERWARAEGLEPPRLYSLGFHHNNCGGFCVKAGQAQFRQLLRELPDRYAYHERKEQELRDYLGKDVSILKDRTGGETRPLTMAVFRKRIEAGGQYDMFEWGGCGCALDDTEDADA